MEMELDFTGLTTDEKMEKWRREFVRVSKLKEKQEEEDLQEGKYIFIF
jgi:hypothetical protein